MPLTRLWFPVHQPLSFRSLDRRDHPVSIGLLPAVPHEAALRAVSVQVFLAHVVMNAEV